MSKLTEAQRRAEQQVRDALSLIIEARRELTLWHFEQFVRENMAALGSHGFVGSIGGALTNAATIDHDAGRAALQRGSKEGVR